MENKLAQIRREKKIGQSYLVDMLGVSRQTISSIENGRCTDDNDINGDDVLYILKVIAHLIENK